MSAAALLASKLKLTDADIDDAGRATSAAADLCSIRDAIKQAGSRRLIMTLIDNLSERAPICRDAISAPAVAAAACCSA